MSETKLSGSDVDIDRVSFSWIVCLEGREVRDPDGVRKEVSSRENGGGPSTVSDVVGT